MPETSDTSTFFGLRWAVKLSFLSYVARTPGGRAYVDGGVKVTSENELVFPLAGAPDSTDADGDTLTFGGQVRFVAHGGLLYVQISEPVIQLSGGAGVLTVTSSNEDGEPVSIPLVSFTVTSEFADADAMGWEATDVRLSSEGVGLFSEVYPAGEAMAPLALRLPLC